MHVVSDLIESHSPVFFFVCKKLSSAFCDLLLNEKPMKPFVFLNSEISEASRSRLLFVPQKAWPSFLHTFLLENEVQTRGKNYRAVIFYEIGDHMQKFSSFGCQKKKLDQNST